jgi:hypothetical protein
MCYLGKKSQTKKIKFEFIFVGTACVYIIVLVCEKFLAGIDKLNFMFIPAGEN